MGNSEIHGRRGGSDANFVSPLANGCTSGSSPTSDRIAIQKPNRPGGLRFEEPGMLRSFRFVTVGSAYLFRWAF
jgi:hypothetical protein